MQDDGKTIEIMPTCFDHHGDCYRWKNEGFCDPNRETRFTRDNPSWRNWVMENCFVSCKIGCGKNLPDNDEL